MYTPWRPPYLLINEDTSAIVQEGKETKHRTYTRACIENTPGSPLLQPHTRDTPNKVSNPDSSLAIAVSDLIPDVSSQQAPLKFDGARATATAHLRLDGGSGPGLALPANPVNQSRCDL
ncbi:uncharacterized protein QC761_0014440 [Podospora bellae-mahoneyi]|uniref:Uncharacterized protein n=1 Tax=Podospora bellae-mahoneyi TaxID=2093777 RepID=A0ABR0FZ66_9PEZI|nr:hypothetical protein QC761_0014440 [Podospora bellae-mahoneyi]